MASFKILKLRSKKYDFLFLSYLFFFFFTSSAYTHSACYFELWERKFVGILQFFRKQGLDEIFATFSTCFFRKVEKHITHAFTQLDTQRDFQSVDGKQLLSLFAQLHRYSWIFSSSHSSCLPFSFLSPQYLEFFMYNVNFIKYKIPRGYLGSLNQGR